MTASKKKKPTLPKKSIEEVKSLEKRVANPLSNQSVPQSHPLTSNQSNIILYNSVSSTVHSVPLEHKSSKPSRVSV